MIRGVYFDAWFPRQHCYHPSLPGRRLRMIDDLRDYRATTLVWSALGGGSISLPYLEEEAFGEIDPRFRFYGFVNDSEFIRECQKYGIQVFGIVFEVQGWEIPAELDEDESRVLALNELRGAGKRAWMGLREFSGNRYPKLWAPVEKYFPNGLINSDGEPVTDLIEECVSRDIHGEPCHARWVECTDREHECYLMDRNNPVWREYLKAVIRTQIDAGVDGIQLDEAETPITSFQYGGCFCKDCMNGFREYLQSLPEALKPVEISGIDLESFHYGQWLLAQGLDFKRDQESTPLFWDYHRFQIRQVKRFFSELADYARQYAAEVGRDVLVSGNFFNLVAHWYYPLESEVDLIITEMRNTRYRQPEWYRYVAGFAGSKPVIVVENPYGGIVPELIEKLKIGKGYDLFRMSLYEAAALGANMSVPYGSWMGSVIQDSFYAPHELCKEIQGFLAENEHLFSRETYAETAVVYSVETEFLRASSKGLFADNRFNASTSEVGAFWDICEKLTRAAQPYDVLFFPDGVLRQDSLRLADLKKYRQIILPDCRILTERQADLLLEYLEAGGRLVATGKLGANLNPERLRWLLAHPAASWAEDFGVMAVEKLLGGAQVRIDPPDDLAINIQKAASGAAVHLLRYGYHEEEDAVPDLKLLTVEVRLPDCYPVCEVYAPGKKPVVSLRLEGNRHILALKDVPLYSIILLRKEM